MNTMSSERALKQTLRPPPSLECRSTLDQTAIANGAAMRRVRVKDIEDDMDMACEQAALGPHLRNRSTGRDTWDAPTWRRYVDEAIIQARLHNHELENLRREARQLERLLQAP